MPSLLVLRDNYTIDERQFQETLLVIGEKELYWHFYPSEAGIWTTSVNHLKTIIPENRIKKGGQQLAIIHKEMGYEINFVLPHWELSINGSKLPKGFYKTFDVDWKEINLAYLGYEFLFTFDISNNEDRDFPKPVY
jgi:hypothetical protein